jgi:hypothetical protein
MQSARSCGVNQPVSIVPDVDEIPFTMPAIDPHVTGRRNGHQPEAATGFDDAELDDAADVARIGQEIDAQGVPYVLDGIVPAFGMLGFIVAYAKVGKTTFGQALAAHVAMGRPFLGRATMTAAGWCWPPKTRPSTPHGWRDT